MDAKVYWLYELTKGQGVYQGCTGPGAEGIVRRVVLGEEEAGEPFPVICVNGGIYNVQPRIVKDVGYSTYVESTVDYVMKNIDLAVALLDAAATVKQGG